MAAAAPDPALDASVESKAEAVADVDIGKGGRQGSAGAGATIRPGAALVLLGFLLGFAAAVICDFPCPASISPNWQSQEPWAISAGERSS